MLLRVLDRLAEARIGLGLALFELRPHPDHEYTIGCLRRTANIAGLYSLVATCAANGAWGSLGVAGT